MTVTTVDAATHAAIGAAARELHLRGSMRSCCRCMPRVCAASVTFPAYRSSRTRTYLRGHRRVDHRWQPRSNRRQAELAYVSSLRLQRLNTSNSTASCCRHSKHSFVRTCQESASRHELLTAKSWIQSTVVGEDAVVDGHRRERRQRRGCHADGAVAAADPVWR